jgi:hypothetical protein
VLGREEEEEEEAPGELLLPFNLIFLGVFGSLLGYGDSGDQSSIGGFSLIGLYYES